MTPSQRTRAEALLVQVRLFRILQGVALVGSAVFKPDHETNLLCHQDHGPDMGRPPLHVPGYQPPDRDKFEARIVMLREVYPDFNERAFRCMGPSRYYAAVAREELKRRAEAETPDR